MMVRPELLAELDPGEAGTIRRSMRRVGRGWRVFLMLGFSWLPTSVLYLCWFLYDDGERLAAWIVLFGIASFVVPNFYKAQNMLNLVTNNWFIIILGIGVTFLLIESTIS